MSSSEENSSVPDELNSDFSEEGPLGGAMGSEEGEAYYDDEMAGTSEQGEEEMSEDEERMAIAQAKFEQMRRDSSTAAEGEDDDIVDEDQLATNIETKREAAISQLLAKEDLGLIQMRIKETVRILSNYRELADPSKSRSEYMESLRQDVSSSYDYNLDLLELLFDLFSP